jgi:hypothetical protein
MQNKRLIFFLGGGIRIKPILKQSIEGFIVTSTLNPPRSGVIIIKCLCVCACVCVRVCVCVRERERERQYMLEEIRLMLTILYWNQKEETWICGSAYISWFLQVHSGIFGQNRTRPRSLPLTRFLIHSFIHSNSSHNPTLHIANATTKLINTRDGPNAFAKRFCVRNLSPGNITRC